MTMVLTGHGALYCILVLLCQGPSLSSGTIPKGAELLVAPLYISNAQLCSTVVLANKTDDTVHAVVVFDSLEGEETASHSISLAARSSLSMDLDSVAMVQHRFAGLGSITVVASPGVRGLVGKIIMTSRNADGIHVEEDLQEVDSDQGPLFAASVPAPFSAPVLALRSLGQVPQYISVTCFDSAGQSYESQLILPERTTFLINACISEREESRTYEQLLNGDIGLIKGTMTIKVRTKDAPGQLAVWGFAAARMAADSRLHLIGIEFRQ